MEALFSFSDFDLNVKYYLFIDMGGYLPKKEMPRQKKIQIKDYIRFTKIREKDKQMFVLVWTNEGQYGIINSDLFHNFDVHTWKSLNGFFKLSAEVYNFRMVQKIGFSNQNSSKSHFLEIWNMCLDEFLANSRTF